MTSIAILGATGDIGRAVTAEALQRGWHVTAVGRDPGRLAALRDELAAPRLRTVTGSVATERLAQELLRALPAGQLGGIVAAVNGPKVRRPLAEWTDADLMALLQADLIPHFIAAKAFTAALPDGAVYLGIGGGMADFVARGNGHNSMVQAAQRMMFRTLARELRPDGVHVREIMVASMVNGRSTRSKARPEWLTAEEIAGTVCDVLADPAAYPGPIITMSAADRAGPPSNPASAGEAE
jgi:NAD(P)-dependent dehydrogenase (short-subunit alcohol dehydrogenase family)